VEIPKSLIDAPVDLVEISIDAGGKARYEASRVRGNYEILMRNLERLHRMRNESKSRTMINIRLMVRPSNKSQ
jgi:MoaA/NifB/PqqE/SkfB family radical SAM enzyme